MDVLILSTRKARGGVFFPEKRKIRESGLCFFLISSKFACMLDGLETHLASGATISEKLAVLDPLVSNYLSAKPALSALLLKQSEAGQLAIKQIIAIGQADFLFPEEIDEGKFNEMLEKLILVDYFYREIGGIVGYQAKILDLLKQTKTRKIHGDIQYHSPNFIDISKRDVFVEKAVAWGLDNLDQIAEIYPLGGAADRLHLVEEKTGVELPAAKLLFAGKALLEHLIRDLQAREYLYFKMRGKQITTPLAIMTSFEKNNHAHVLAVFEEHQFFGRDPAQIRLFTQPLVPAVTESGNWCLRAPLEPVLKPGGHGAIWKLAKDSKIFEWLESLGRSKALVRQINNPLAGLDYGLLAFSGIGCRENMLFGFASCPRLLKAAEGVNVLIEKGSHLVLTNIEYCDFEQFGIEDFPLKENEPYSRFSSNTNILFADLKAISDAVDRCPFPGLLINLKKSSYRDKTGSLKEEMMARLESTMQNIADVFVEEKKEKLGTEKTFVTYNQRHKTISTAKRGFSPGGKLQETPENCFYDLLKAHRELLVSCGFDLPKIRDLETMLEKGPEFVFLYHPALGPLYSLIEKKLQKGSLGTGSECIFELADLQVKNLNVQGSFQVIAEQPLGHFNSEGILQFSDRQGSCYLENVAIENRGVDWQNSRPYWKMDLRRHETVKIILKGKSRFVARNMRLKGSHTFVVEDGQVMEI